MTIKEYLCSTYPDVEYYKDLTEEECKIELIMSHKRLKKRLDKSNLNQLKDNEN